MFKYQNSDWTMLFYTGKGESIKTAFSSMHDPLLEFIQTIVNLNIKNLDSVEINFDQEPDIHLYNFTKIDEIIHINVYFVNINEFEFEELAIRNKELIGQNALSISDLNKNIVCFFEEFIESNPYNDGEFYIFDYKKILEELNILKTLIL